METGDVTVVSHVPPYLYPVNLSYRSMHSDAWRDQLKHIVVEDIKPLVNIPNRPNKSESMSMSRSPVLPPCRVCGAKASGFHYGVNTCEACKGFFRRSLSRQGPYSCSSSGNCEIKKGRRTSCAYCRQKRCIEVGMSKTAIKTGRYTHQLRSKNILEVKMLEKGGSVVENQISGFHSVVHAAKVDSHQRPTEGHVTNGGDQNKTVILQELEDLATILTEAYKKYPRNKEEYWDDSMMLKRQQLYYQQYLNKLALARKGDFFLEGGNKDNDGHVTSGGPAHVPDYLISTCVRIPEPNSVALVSNGYRCDAEAIIRDVTAYMEDGVISLVNFGKSIPGFNKLSLQDQASLLKASCFDVWFVANYRCINHELNVFAGGVAYHGDEIAPIWGEELVGLLQSLGRMAHRLNFSPCDVAILLAILITFPDRVEVSNRELLEEIHDTVVECFRYISRKKFSNLESRFSKVIDFVVRLRELSDSFGSATKQMQQESQSISVTKNMFCKEN